MTERNESKTNLHLCYLDFIFSNKTQSINIDIIYMKTGKTSEKLINISIHVLEMIIMRKFVTKQI